MLTRDLESQSLPYLHLTDKVYQALQLMNDNHVTHLPVVEGDKFTGLISEDDLLMADNDHDELQTLSQSFSTASVKGHEHFLKAVQVATENGLTVVPVISEDGDIISTLAYNDLLRKAAEFLSVNEPGGLIVLEVDSNQYSFNEISKLVETNDAQITQLNTSNDPETGVMLVTIRINKPEVSDVVSTFQRYEYNVRYFFGEELYTNELKSNYDHLMHYLKI